MQIWFYCTPEDLQEVFIEAEHACPIAYEPRFGNLPRIMEVEDMLRRPLYSYREFHTFGRAYYGTPPFEVYASREGMRQGSPSLLYFSGPPASLEDTHVLCEGSLFLEPENREESARAFYKYIRKIIAKRFVKSGYCFLSPTVYGSRREYLFIQRDHNFLAPAWCFDDEDHHVPTDIDTWYQTQGRQRSQYTKPSSKFRYFAAPEDLRPFFSRLEEKYSLKYVAVVRQGNGGYRETIYGSFDAFLGDSPCACRSREVYVCEKEHRMLLHLKTDCLWEQCGKAAGAGEATEVQDVFGDRLYRDFTEMVKERFREVAEKEYGPFYVSPLLYAQRHNIILSLDDPYFRIDGDGGCARVWRREWEGLLAQWGMASDRA